MSQEPKLVAVQSAHPSDARRDVPRVLERAARAVAGGGIAVLPEYFYMPPGGPPTRERLESLTFVEDALREASAACDGALVGTVPELVEGAMFNTALVVEGGKVVHRQRKVRPTEGEREAGIRPHHDMTTADVQGVTLGVLVCADVLALDLLSQMGALRPDVVAVPVMSRHREDDVTRDARTAVFVARAWDLGAYVVKAGGHHRPPIVGRSLITAPWGVLAQARDDYGDAVLAARFERERLARVRGDFEGLGVPEASEGQPS